MEEPINSTNTPPPDMWDDRDAMMPESVMTAHRQTRYTWQWWLTLLLIILITGGAGYVASRYWSDVADWISKLISSVPSTTNDSGTGIEDDQVAWQPHVQIADLGLILSDAPIGIGVGVVPINPTPAKYYKVGQFISGPYSNGDLLIAALPIGNIDQGARFYYFTKSNSNLVFLAQHSPELSAVDRIDQSKFTVDRDYRIATLYFPIRLDNPRSESEPLVLDDAVAAVSNRWFDEALLTDRWQKASIDQVWGDIYTDPLPDGTSSTTPQYGFYVEAPDGTIRTYRLTASVLRNDILQTDIPSFVWEDGTSSIDEYIMFEMGECRPLNLAAVMPDALLEEIVAATTTTDPNRPIYEFKDKNHSMLKTLFKEASSRADNKGLTYQKFLDNHPIFFWRDSFGRLIKFQSKKYVSLPDCE